MTAYVLNECSKMVDCTYVYILNTTYFYIHTHSRCRRVNRVISQMYVRFDVFTIGEPIAYVYVIYIPCIQTACSTTRIVTVYVCIKGSSLFHCRSSTVNTNVYNDTCEQRVVIVLYVCVRDGYGLLNFRTSNRSDSFVFEPD